MWIHAAPQLVESGDIDYLVADYLSEITMSLLTSAKQKSPVSMPLAIYAQQTCMDDMYVCACACVWSSKVKGLVTTLTHMSQIVISPLHTHTHTCAGMHIVVTTCTCGVYHVYPWPCSTSDIVQTLWRPSSHCSRTLSRKVLYMSLHDRVFLNEMIHLHVERN